MNNHTVFIQTEGGSTLVYASKQTCFCYKVICSEPLKKQAKQYTQGEELINFLLDKGVSVYFSHISNSTYANNLNLIDSDLPLILAECFLAYYRTKKANLPDLLTYLDRTNPCHFPTNHGISFYSFKLKKLLLESAKGMKPCSRWSGTHDPKGGYVIASEFGETPYHILQKNIFINHLLERTRLDLPPSSINNHGFIYDIQGETYINLNLQIRFKKQFRLNSK